MRTISSRLRPHALAGAAALVAALAVPARAAVPVSAYQELRWRCIGPFRAGWATAVCGVPGDRVTFYFGGAGGGVWRTPDAGLTWTPLMQHEGASAIGALAVAASDPNVLWAGTGQADSRYDVMPGDGVYRSDDAGATWRHAGLADTRHIGAILVDPHDPERVLVAALGHAFGPNAERGVFRTTDGGRHWQAVLAPGDSVGAVDLAWDPADPRIVYAALWQRRLHPWLDYFQPQVGAGSGLWRSDDEGAHWTRLAGGLPGGALGRIGVAVAPGSRGRIAYACIADAPAGSGGLWATHDGGAHWTRANGDGSLASSYFARLTVSPADTNTVYVMGMSIRRSTDGGVRFDVMRGSPGGDDYHALWIDAADPRRMISGSDQGAAVSLNGGATWSSWYNQPTGQFYHLGADDRFPYHVYSGQQDNGTAEVASRGPYGVIEERDWHPVGGDERDDMIPKPGEPRTVFGSGLGGGVSRFDDETRQSAEIAPWPIGSYAARPTTVRWRYGWITPLAVSPRPPHALWLGAQGLFRSTDEGDHWSVASPDLTGRREGAGDCANPDAAAARDCGFGVVAAIAPSPLAAGLVWAGTDDGRIHVTHDDGAHWADVTPPQLPAWGIVFAIDASPHDTSSAYAAVDLHRLDRHEPLLLRTHDGGRTWTTIVGGLPPGEFTSVVRADPRRAGLLYAGTHRAVYVSFDDGAHWQPLSGNLPVTWMRDLLVHHGDLIVATQGRGLWILDDIAPLAEANDALATSPLHLFTPSPAVRLRGSESHDTPWPPETPLGENPPTGAILDYWLTAPPPGPLTLTISDSAGTVVRRFASDDSLPAPGPTYFQREWQSAPQRLASGAGMHRFVWDLREATPDAPGRHNSIAAVWGHGTPVFPAGPFVPPGRYTATLAAGGRSMARAFDVALDPRVRVSAAAIAAQRRLAGAAYGTLARVMTAMRAAEGLERAAPGGTRAAAPGDSLAAIVSACSGVANTLASLGTAVEAADAAPSQGLYDAIAETTEAAERVLARWARLAPARPGARR